eukprot:2622584-Amphidinium_carterae.2
MAGFNFEILLSRPQVQRQLRSIPNFSLANSWHLPPYKFQSHYQPETRETGIGLFMRADAHWLQIPAKEFERGVRWLWTLVIASRSFRIQLSVCCTVLR